MKKIVTIIGARPQFIKAAAVSRIARDFPVEEVLVHTGQHFDANMSQIFFDEMGIPRPDYNLDIHSLSHGAMTGRMLEKIEEVLFTEKPDILMVYGDTNSTLAGALAAQKCGIPVAHVEAGLRSFNMAMPEEVNRILTDRISTWLFCPTDKAVENLQKEGFDNFPASVIRTGDVMYDAALYFKEISDRQSHILEKLQLSGRDFVLCTLHRQENTDDPVRLKSIFAALEKIHRQIPVVIPLHPRTSKILEQFDLQPSVRFIEPLGYLDMLQLLDHTRLVLTDSGGMQKEASFFGKFCITLREETEWTELIDAGVNFLGGHRTSRIVELFENLISLDYPDTKSPYGDGNAGTQILQHLVS